MYGGLRGHAHAQAWEPLATGAFSGRGNARMIVHRPREKSTAAATRVSAVSTLDSPTHSVAPAADMAPSKGSWMMLFQAVCSTTASHTLPDSSRTRAIT